MPQPFTQTRLKIFINEAASACLSSMPDKNQVVERRALAEMGDTMAIGFFSSRGLRKTTKLCAVASSASLFLFSAPLLIAQSGTQDSYSDCVEVDLVFSNLDQPLTRQEEIQLQRQKLEKSMQQSELCKQSGGGSGGGGSGGGGSGGGSGGGDSGNGSQGSNATASQSGSQSAVRSDISGTEDYSTEYSQASKTASTNPTASSQVEMSEPKPVDLTALANGSPPADIPAVNTDDQVALEMRIAAQSEKDPARAKLLWNEYRKYKNLKPEE